MEFSAGIVIFLASLSLSCADIPPVYYLNERCSSQIQFSNAVIIKLARNSKLYLQQHLVCQTNISTQDVSDKLLLRIRLLNTVKTYCDCELNTLTIYDTDGTILGGNICGKCKPFKLNETAGNSLQLVFKTDRYERQTGNFEVLITSFNYGNNDSCFVGDFRCENERCIYNGLTCDGFNNCGDNSDESDRCGPGYTYGVYITIGIGSFAFLCLIILGIWCGRVYFEKHQCCGQNNSYENLENTLPEVIK